MNLVVQYYAIFSIAILEKCYHVFSLSSKTFSFTKLLCLTLINALYHYTKLGTVLLCINSFHHFSKLKLEDISQHYLLRKEDGLHHVHRGLICILILGTSLSISVQEPFFIICHYIVLKRSIPVPGEQGSANFQSIIQVWFRKFRRKALVKCFDSITCM
ncbi:hypothetical protein CEXT_85581 [Caerostris extrusa]|uniref:Uncharacterized protein n=1 Tax=Caerostris extrusa TaxID=172846 RepID=A0AAV4Y7V6_CAEEX|nr:hypothetical protein CEXT_85581 [Caerostris extrusa]